MICSYCGTDLPLGAMFCGECGRPVAARAATRTRSRSSANSVATATRWPVSVAEHQPEEPADIPARPPRKPAGVDAAAHTLVEPPRAADAVYADPPPSAAKAAAAARAVAKAEAAEKAAADALELATAQSEADATAHAEAEAAGRADAEAAAAAQAEVEAAAKAEAAAQADAEAAAQADAEAAAQEAEAAARAEAEAAEKARADARARAEAAEAAEAQARAEAELAARADAERAEDERAEAERAEAERVEKDRAEAERAEVERLVSEKLEAARVEAEHAAAAAAVVSDAPEVQDLVDLQEQVETCTQCGAPLAASDIFCGVCGFVRKPAAASAPRPNDTVAYDPFPWGLPRAADIVPVELAPEPPDESYDDDSDIEKTRIVDRSVRGDRFVLQFSTGESVSVSGTGLIGRNPVSEPGEYFDALVTIVDPGKSVSKTHLEFGQDAGAFWVSDRFSANGTVLREPDRPARRGDAGKRYRLVRGTRVDIGEQFFIVS